MTLFKAIRILILLLVFAALAFYAKSQKLKARSWAAPLEVFIYPINGDHNSPVVNEYINELDESVFAPIDRFVQQQAQRYQLITSRPLASHLGPVMTIQPPASPPPGSNMAAILWWSMQFRYWVYKNTPDDESNHHRIRVFVLYHEPHEGRKLQHSLGLDKGLVAVVHAFAAIDQDQQNNIVIAHELLHTVGATDKYAVDGEPVFPAGYANREQSPLYPQDQAEIMAVRIPLSEGTSRMAESLDACVIGTETAREINWLSSNDS